MRATALALLPWLLSLLGTGPAAAHAVLESTLPPDGALLAEAPASAVLRFNEPVAVVRVALLDAHGEAVAGVEASADGEEVRVDLPMLADGTYLLTYRVASLDSHPIGGSILFAVGEAAVADAPRIADPSANEAGWQLALVMLRTLIFTGLLAAGGLLLFLIGVGPPVAGEGPAWCLAAVGLAAAAPALLLSIGCTGGLLSAAPAAGLFDRAVWAAGWSSSFGTSAMLALAGVLFFAAAYALPGRKALALAGTGLFLSAFLLTGHAAVAEPRWLFFPAMAVHLLAAAFWFGSAIALALLLAETGPREAAPVVRRFSAIAVPGVGLLLLAGVALAAIQLGSLHALGATGYGRILLGKLVAVALLLLLAACNKWRYTPRLAAGDLAAHRDLRRFVRAELALMLLVLLLTAILTQTAPPHAPARVAAPGSAGVTAAAQSGDIMAMLEIAPARAGRNAIRLFLHDAQGQPVDPSALEIELAEPDRGIEPIRRQPIRVAPGRYLLEGPELALAGDWAVTVRARLGDFDTAEFEFLLPVGEP
jgi:copper transport protein